MLDTMRGAGGGGKGGGGGSFVQKPDTLRSDDTFEGLLGLCSGPIKGPVNGTKSIRLNGTAITGTDGKDNFPGVVSFFADGDPLKFPQSPTLKLGAAGAPTNIGVDIPNTNTAGTPGPWVSRTINNIGADAIDLRFIVEQLFKQSDEGIFENSLTLELQMKPTGTTTWINPFASNGNSIPSFNPNGLSGKDGMMRVIYSLVTHNGLSTVTSSLQISGKTTSSNYVKELRINVPKTGAYANKSWDVQVRLLEPASVDNDPNFEKRTVQWESMAAVYHDVLGTHEDWRALSWLQIYGQASDNFNGLPSVDGIYDTKIVSVPPANVYNPDTRVYSGATWDGSWAKSYTNDPAWCLNDLITDSISGVSAFVPGARLNKWDALELSKWASTLVPDGAGGFHPRYSLNIFVDQAQKCDDMVRYLAGACGATAWDAGNGEWRVKVDKPEIPAAVFTHETIEGEFAYSNTDIDSRFNDITVVFLNEEFDYKEDWIHVEDEDHIAKYGRKPTRLVTVGCTNRQQALRWAVLRLRTNVNEWRMVNFTTNRQGKMLEQFNHILVADGSLNNLADDQIRRTTGRIIENRGGSVLVRDPMRLEIGAAYSLRVTCVNPEYHPEPTSEPAGVWQQPTITVSIPITNAADQRGDVTELFLATPLPAGVAENANVALEAVGLPAIPKVYRVLDLDYNDDGERVAVSAIEVDTGKWPASDSVTDATLQESFSDTIQPPTEPAGGMFTLSAFTGQFGLKRVLTANWDRPASRSFDKYRLEYRLNQGPWQDLGFQRDDFWELAEPVVGRHELRVYAMSNRGFASLPITGLSDVSDIPSSLAVGFGPTTIAATYDYTGSTPQDLPKDQLYKLLSNGITVADVTWQYRVTDGGVNGFGPGAGWQAMTVEDGVGTFTLNTVQVAASQVEIRGIATAGGSASATIAITKKLSDPPVSGGGSTTAPASQTSGFTGIATPYTSFVPITSELQIDVPSGKTATNTVIDLTALMPRTAPNLGPWNIEYKLQRKVNGVWTDVGAVQNSDPDPYIDQEVVDRSTV